VTTFDPIVFPPASPGTIPLIAALPNISQGNLTIDGSNAGVILDGSGMTAGTGGLRITSSGNVVRGLQIIHFSGEGVQISGGAQNNTIGGNRLVGSGPLGQGNLISGNDPHGITIIGSGAVSNTVVGNYIGTNVSGTVEFGNVFDGVKIESSYNQVGGATPGERNLISGNGDNGVRITGSDARNNAIRGNLIGTDASGTVALGNAGSGVLLADDAQNNTIGGITANERNVISGNSEGVHIGVQKTDQPAHHNLIIGNYIGTDSSGAAAIGNHVGVQICDGSADNTVGGSTAGERNVIAGSRKSGVHLCGGAVRNRIIGNYLGTDASGTTGLGNAEGVGIQANSQQNTIGPGNLIAYNAIDGVWIRGASSIFNTVTRNAIHSNTALGMNNVDGGNQELPPPILKDMAGGNIITGTACANCTVEVFSDFQDEGGVYEGSTTADGSGNFSYNKPGGFTGPNLTATATNAVGNTSEFSSPVKARYFAYLPLALR